MKVLSVFLACFLLGLDATPILKPGQRTAQRSRPYVGHKVITIKAESEAHVGILRDLQDDGHLMLDFLTHPHLGPVNVRVPPGSMTDLLVILQTAGITRTVAVEDLQAEVDKSFSSNSRNALCNLENPPHDQCYLHLDQIRAYVETLQERNAGLTIVDSNHVTYQGRPLWYVKVSTGGANKQAVVVETLTHAREWVTGSVALDMMDKFTSGYGLDDDVTFMLDMFDWYFMPVHNPDGYSFTWTNERLWRKNLEPCGIRGVGTDLNRNWQANWGGVGSSGNCLSDTYRGPSAMSAVETTFLDLVVKEIPDVLAFVSLHSYSQMIFVPYGFSKTTDYSDKQYHLQIAHNAADAIRKTSGKEFVVGTPGDILYEASGGAFDHFKYLNLAPISLTYELRPSQQESNIGFLLPAEQIKDAQEETWASFVSLTRDFSMYKTAATKKEE